jgi:putative transposase
MGIATFSAGAIVEMDGKKYELKRKVDQDLWQLEDARTKRVVEYDDSKLRSSYAEGKLKFVSKDVSVYDKHGKTLLAAYDGPKWEQAKLRRHYAKAILDLPGTAARIQRVVIDVWNRLGALGRCPSARTVLRWRQRFLAKTQDVSSLIERDHRKGNREERHDKEVQRIVREAIDKKYLTLERNTIQKTLEHALDLINKENRLRVKAEQLALPTRRLVKRMIGQIPAYDRCAARFGALAARRRFRSVKGHIFVNAPLERAEMDHSQLDLMVIDDKSNLPLGRPWLTICIDVYSRCILGYFLSFQPPSYLSVARCLRHAFLPKSDLHTQHPEIVNPWDAHGVMKVLVVDNGPEFHSDSFDNLCFSVGMDIVYAPRKTPWFKPHVERVQGTLNREVAHGAPGKTFSNIFEKGDYDPAKHSVVRYGTLKKALAIWIADVYQQRVHRTLDTTPAAMWSSAIKPEDVPLPDDLVNLDVLLGSSAARVLSHKGIEFEGLSYNSPDLTELRMRYGEKLKVDIRFDEADLGTIAVLSPDKTDSFKVPALNCNYASGLSLWQHRIIKNYARKLRLKHSSVGWLEAKALIAELIETDILRKKKKSRSRVARYLDQSIKLYVPTAADEDVIDAEAEEVLEDEFATDDSRHRDEPKPPKAPTPTHQYPVVAEPAKRFTASSRVRDSVFITEEK